MEFIGKIIHIGPIEQFLTKDGRSMYSRDIVLQTDEQYPKTACFTLRNDLAQDFNHNINETIHLRFDISAKTNKEGTRWFNQLIAWRVSKLQ